MLTSGRAPELPAFVPTGARMSGGVARRGVQRNGSETAVNHETQPGNAGDRTSRTTQLRSSARRNARRQRRRERLLDRGLRVHGPPCRDLPIELNR